jgi:hypothetical protein
VNAADSFCELLRARLAQAQHQADDLALRGPLLRCDPLFEAGADLSDMVVAYAEGRVGASVVRQEALRVAALAFRVFTATCGTGPLSEAGDGGQ